ncbi:hypothetical protein C900_02733 [Fulvivirga imtechensis AK7]|uniref:histidine kinase n=1 Tax=Fulvivirga imtechensis AK7 TaxID=1237149 RepID=L8JVY4_9BACT|nr:transporter substrate-binding domain-containing protein [Fulvivirga imtechensis]ELR71392.1 hypothetical protein C900_02733 [Fulvivirga imtechensis AK7]
MKLYLLSFLLLLSQNAFSFSEYTLLSAKERQWLQANKDNIRFGPNPTWRPTDYVDFDGVHQGIVSDYIKLFEKRLGVSFTYQYFDDWSGLLRGLQNREVDFVGAIQKTTRRDDFLNFSDSYLEIPIVIIVRNDYPRVISHDNMKGMKLAGVSDYASVEYIKNRYPEARVIEYKDDLTALVQTSMGNTDGTIIDLLTASHLVEEYGITNLALGLTLNYKWEIRFAISQEMPELEAIINKLLNSINEEQRAAIYHKWVNIDNLKSENFFERNYERLIYLSAFILMVFIIVLLYSYVLKRQVRNRTLALKKSNEQYSYVTKATFDAIWDLDLVASTLTWGEGFYTLFGYDVNHTSTSHAFWRKYIHPDDKERVSKSLWMAISGEDSTWKESYRYLKINGEYAYVQDKAVIIRDESGKAIRMIGAIQDVTERRKYIRAIENQNTQLREIAHIQSHVVRAPLARIMGLINLVKTQDLDPQQSELLEYIKTSAHDLDQVVRGIVRQTERIEEDIEIKF